MFAAVALLSLDLFLEENNADMVKYFKKRLKLKII